ncbi:MAG: lipopolysaccharide kinase InaA family protein, partial [Phycisphaerae bacterium]|nr:lipopolysaccharide kinase InaA family protein [Phycisphaerae bacterium]
YLYESCFEPAADDPPFPGARPPELVAIYRNRRPGSGEIIKTVATELAALAVTLHRAGAYFNDLHPGNILVVRDEEPMLYLADLGRLTFRGSRDALLRHIVLLNAFFEPISTQTERFHFWKALGKHHDVPIPRPEQIAEATWRHRRRIYSRRDKRWAKFNKYVARVEAGPWRGRAVTDWLDAAQAVALAAAHPMSGGDARVVKHSGASTVIETDWGGRMPIVLKRDNRRGPVRQLRRMLGRCRAQRAWRIGHGLLMRGIPTARPAAVLERYAHGIAVETLLATEKIEDATRLDMWFKQRTSASERRGIIEQLARLVGRLHDLGISQRDLKAPNILVRNKGAGHVQLYLIDLDGLRFRRRVRPGRRLQNLMRLNVSGDEIGLVSRSDRLRFLRTYLRRPGRGALPSVSPHRWGAQGRAVRDIRRWWHRIAEASARKWVRLEKRQRERLARQSMTGR